MSNSRGRARYSLVVMTLCGVSALGRSRGWSTRMTQPVMGGSLSSRCRYAKLGRSCVRSQRDAIRHSRNRNGKRLRRPRCPPRKPIRGSESGGSVAGIGARAVSRNEARRCGRRNSAGAGRRDGSRTFIQRDGAAIVGAHFKPHRPAAAARGARLRRPQQPACEAAPLKFAGDGNRIEAGQAWSLAGTARARSRRLCRRSPRQ